MSIQTPEQIARELYPEDNPTQYALRLIIVAAIEADRKQRDDPPTYAVGDPDPTPDYPTRAPCHRGHPDSFVCTWEKGHHGPHVAGDGETIVEVWDA